MLGSLCPPLHNASVTQVKSSCSKLPTVASVCLSQLVPSVRRGSRLCVIHHSLNYGKPLDERLGTRKFFVAFRLAYKAEHASFYAQLNIDDGCLVTRDG